jgi:hypothetical protein
MCLWHWLHLVLIDLWLQGVLRLGKKIKNTTMHLKYISFLLLGWLFSPPFLFHSSAVMVLNYNKLASFGNLRLFLGHFFLNSLLVHSPLISCEGLESQGWFFTSILFSNLCSSNHGVHFVLEWLSECWAADHLFVGDVRIKQHQDRESWQ